MKLSVREIPIEFGIVQFIAFFRGRTPFPKWYCLFNLLLGKAVFNGVRRLGNTALLLGWKRYAGDREYILLEGTSCF